ncbi:hypothetical protein TL16_g06479 [Triparma laevis f. inornata]|uniref:Protein kinase domain-containing protein n=1 Tax=Triparma laevis f. inornata TaxID=1714386 RepID=A0A9W7AU91_9STRA|nr:hypothetical protein TL16_g06479 [Triparma laevis f. inornata]
MELDTFDGDLSEASPEDHLGMSAMSTSSRPGGIFPRLDASAAFSAVSGRTGQSRPMSAAGERSKTVRIPGFSSEKAADFWFERYGTPCPFFNALENIQVAPGGAGGGVGGSGVFALKPTGRGSPVQATREVMSHASKHGTPKVQRPKSGKRRPYSARPAGMRGPQPKLTLFDPENRKSPIRVTNTKFRRGKSKVERLREEVQTQVDELRSVSKISKGETNDEEEEEYGDDEFENDGGESLSEQLQKVSSKNILRAKTPPIPEHRVEAEVAVADAVNVPAKIMLKKHPMYMKYFTMTKMGLPIGAAVGRATQDGVNPVEIEAVLNRDPEEIVDNPAAKGPTPTASTAPTALKITPQKPKSPVRPNLKLTLSPEMLDTAKDGLQKTLAANRGNQTPLPNGQMPLHYVPQSPLNLKSSILVNALNKGKAKLRKNNPVPAQENKVTIVESTEGVNEIMKKIGSKGNLLEKKKEEERVVASEKHVLLLKEAAKSKLIAIDDVIIASNAFVYGRGRFGRVVKGVMQVKKIKKRLKSKFERHQTRHLEVTGADPDSPKAQPDNLHVAVKQVAHKREYLPAGLLQTIIREVESLELCKGLVLGGGLELKWKLKLYLDLARGLEMIHSKNVVHADIKSHNMLVNFDEDTGVWSAVVGDLGNAILLEEEEGGRATKVQGTSGWTAPEVFTGEGTGEGYGLKSDIFSFGLVLCDGLTGGVNNPLVGVDPDLYVEKLRAGERPELPESDGTGLGQIISFMWKFSEHPRPTSKQVRERLESIHKSS